MSHRLHILCYVTDRCGLKLDANENSAAALLRKIEATAAAGVGWIQIREKDLSARECASLTREALRLVAQASSGLGPPPRVLVNDRLDVAIAERAGGVHLGENSLPVADAKRLVAASRPSLHDFLIGVSCHSLETAQSAAWAGADYVFFGPVFATPSKAKFGPPQGLARLAEICSALEIPVIAIGGITRENAGQCLKQGAAGIAGIRLFQNAEALPLLVQELRQEGF